MWLFGLLLIVIGISYSINQPLVPPGVHPADHTHAFDIYANPISSLHQNLWETAKETILKQTDIAGLISLAVLAGLVAISVVACYAYYPSPQECLKEIALARAECLTAANSGDKEHALFWLPVWEEWSRRLEVGTYLRHGKLRRYQSMQGYLIRKKLELLEHELEHDPHEPEQVRAVMQSIFATNARWVRAFCEPS